MTDLYSLFGDFNSGDVLFLSGFSNELFGLLIFFALLILIATAIDLRGLSTVRKTLLVGLRVLSLTILVGIILEPALELKHVSHEKNHVAILVDASESMNVGVGEETRMIRAIAFLKELAPHLEELRDKHYFEFFSFGEVLESSTLYELSEQSEGEFKDTRILNSIEEFSQLYGPNELGGLVLISDGIDRGRLGRRSRSGEALDSATREWLTKLDIPIHTVSVSGVNHVLDVSIEEVLHDDFAFVHNKVSVDVSVKIQGIRLRTLPVTLKRQGEIISTQEISVRQDQNTYKVTFEFVPERMGKELYTVSVPVYSGEVLKTNNSMSFLLKIIRDRIRVLHVCGRPTWDVRFLRRLLKENPNVDLISFFILRTASSLQLVPSDQLSLIPFPTRELFDDELGSFDLVIFHNFNFGPYAMRRYLKNVRDFVLNGGGFAMIGGDLSFTVGGYQGSDIESVLPVELPPEGSGATVISEEPFKLSITEAGMRHPITQLAFDPVVNRKLWSLLSPMNGANLVLGSKPEATVLAEHPVLKSKTGKMPVLTVWEAGEGRVLTLTVDSTWRWRMEMGEREDTRRLYTKFWSNAIRWMIRDPELKLTRIDVPEDTLRPGEEAPVKLKLYNRDYSFAANTTGWLRLYRLEGLLEGEVLKGEQKIEEISFKTDDKGSFEWKVPIVKEGAYLVRVSVDGNPDMEDEEHFLVVKDTQELRDIIPRPELLERLSSETGGQFIELPSEVPDLEFAEPRVVKVNLRSIISVWDHPVTLVLLILLLAAEWILRRRFGRF